MKRALFVAVIVFSLMPVIAFSQGAEGISPGVQQMTILPPSIASQVDCCVAPYNKIFVSRRTQVFWDNKSGSDVKLTFGKGTDCKQITGPSQAYEIDSRPGCHVIQNLPQGKTVTIRFTDAGQYDFTIEFLGTDKKPETGSIGVF
jgi:hypothetical protein